jgi:hypothetical protein
MWLGAVLPRTSVLQHVEHGDRETHSVRASACAGEHAGGYAPGVPALTARTRLTVLCRHTALVCSTKSGAALAQTDSSFASYVTHVDAVLSACTHSSHLHAAMVPSAACALSSACCPACLPPLSAFGLRHNANGQERALRTAARSKGPLKKRQSDTERDLDTATLKGTLKRTLTLQHGMLHGVCERDVWRGVCQRAQALDCVLLECVL